MIDHDSTMFFGGGFMWLVWLLIVLVTVLMIKFLFMDAGSSSSNESPMEILKQRYARGEIDEDEYDRLRHKLEL